MDSILGLRDSSFQQKTWTAIPNCSVGGSLGRTSENTQQRLPKFACISYEIYPGKFSHAGSDFRTQYFATFPEFYPFFTGKPFAPGWSLKISGGQQYEKTYLHIADGCDVAFLRTCIQPGVVWSPNRTATASTRCPGGTETARIKLRLGQRVLVSTRQPVPMAQWILGSPAVFGSAMGRTALRSPGLH